jgi:hypothetical protein
LGRAHRWLTAGTRNRRILCGLSAEIGQLVFVIHLVEVACLDLLNHRRMFGRNSLRNHRFAQLTVGSISRIRPRRRRFDYRSGSTSGDEAPARFRCGKLGLDLALVSGSIPVTIPIAITIAILVPILTALLIAVPLLILTARGTVVVATAFGFFATITALALHAELPRQIDGLLAIRSPVGNHLELFGVIFHHGLEINRLVVTTLELVERIA